MVTEKQLANLTKAGCNFGNAGGGRPPEELRRQAREKFEDWLKRLDTKDPEKASIGEIAKVIDTMGKFGLGEKQWDLSESAQLQEAAKFTARYLQDKGQAEWYEEWVQGLRTHMKGL